MFESAKTVALSHIIKMANVVRRISRQARHTGEPLKKRVMPEGNARSIITIFGTLLKSKFSSSKNDEMRI